MPQEPKRASSLWPRAALCREAVISFWGFHSQLCLRGPSLYVPGAQNAGGLFCNSQNLFESHNSYTDIFFVAKIYIL